ncbi:tyrosine-type recombinase/integrase [Clostridium estertheticum]|uniref:tyrosine-type recombinase/integrase n=1 Tax=Clostridium estertheticum TaxID=238834 RepID=UPI001C7D5A4F|nr:tyrosine-type recombinase/integrase [Clostridium estertheticum]MBX4265588.1 tyrosine-type recombinase/integrase [Clostridium estertheticum]MBX4271964.1 tyrosine-type recombinase/integrase [Clostridium estertheticum]WLC82063.1 tyrosine-type recombinase/integrase [Clostridium estertheticum]WLC91067.1 tyrosine-type recombinase/integrase [Clostridium estertheticum]
MPNKKTVALTEEQYKSIIKIIKEGFTVDGKIFKINNRIATILVLEANLGLRIGDVLALTLNSIIRDGYRYRLNIIEDKTDKRRTFTVPIDIYNYIKMYCLENSIRSSAIIFDITERAIQKQLKLACDYLGYENISTHSFRKYFATQIYINNNYNIALVRQLLQHSNTSITQKYIGISTQEVENALLNHIKLL